MGAEKPANDDRIQSEGRKGAGEPDAGAERYPPAGKDDAVEAPNPKPRQGAGDGDAALGQR